MGAPLASQASNVAAALATIQADIARVKDARAKGIAKLENKFLGGEPEQAAIRMIKGLPIDAWAQRGLDAAKAGKAPGLGWPQWVEGGSVFIDGINEITGIGMNATLDAVKATAVDTAKQVETAAKKVAAKTVTAVETVGSTVTTSLKLVVGIAALTVVALMLIRRG